jgi:GNAT superfamily N-acetyltransferase
MPSRPAIDDDVERVTETLTLAFLVWERFSDNHPRDEPHAYLSLLATHPDHRGRGIGQMLLAEDLARLDVDGLAAYLESTNPGNDHRYERAGERLRTSPWCAQRGLRLCRVVCGDAAPGEGEVRSVPSGPAR